MFERTSIMGASDRSKVLPWTHSAQACLEAYVLPTAGHSINLHLNAPDWFAAALAWSDRRVGTHNVPPTDPC